MKTVQELYRSYDDTRKKNIKSHYLYYMNLNKDNGYSYVRFSEWIDSYFGLNHIFNLMSLKPAD